MGTQDLWKPLERNQKHPGQIAERFEKARNRRKQSLDKIKSKDRKRAGIIRNAVRAEKTTQKNIIRATKNSGRSNQDGDHVYADMLLLDTKHQSGLINPVCVLGELDKIRHQAENNGYLAGGLVVRNKYGRGIVMFAEEDHQLIVQARVKKTEK